MGAPSVGGAGRVSRTEVTAVIMPKLNLIVNNNQIEKAYV
jgi:hypothetical protein